MDGPAVVTLANDTLRLVVVPEVGAGVVALEARRGDGWLPVLRPTPAEALARRSPSPLAMFLLAPWSNRIERARFALRDAGDGAAPRVVELRANTPEGYAIHGDVRARPWRVEVAGRTRFTARLASQDFTDFNFPFQLAARVDYELADATFCATLAVTNAGAAPMPCGLGFHPYFPRGAGDADVVLELAARALYPPMPPTASGPPGPVPPRLDFTRPRALAATDANDCFRDWDGRAVIRDRRRGLVTTLRADATLDHVILFTPVGQPFFAVEPVSICNNGFNLAAAGQAGTGTRTLLPGETLTAAFALAVTFG